MARPRKPTILKKMAGTLQPCRSNPFEPNPGGDPLEPPETMTSRGRQFWDDYVDILSSMRVIGVADATAVAQLCECHAQVVDLRDQLQKLGGTIYVSETEQGQTMVRAYPQVSQLADAERRLRGWLTEFGLTPASRSKVSLVVERKASKFDRIGPVPIRGAG